MNVWKLISEGELFTIWLHCSPKLTTKVCDSMHDWLSVKPTGERPLDVDKCEGGPNTSHAQGRRTKRRDAAVKTSWLLNTLNNHSPTQKLVTYIYSTNQTGPANTLRCFTYRLSLIVIAQNAQDNHIIYISYNNTCKAKGEQ